MHLLFLRYATLFCVAFLFSLSPRTFAQTSEPKAVLVESVSPPAEEVPYVQTPMHVVHRMLQLADVTKKDVLWDLGSGDGRIVIAAAKRGALATGFEIDPRLIEESKANTKRARVASRTRFVERDIFTLDFSAPSVVTLYLLPEFNLKLRPLLLSQLKPGSRLVSHEWNMGDWLPDETLVYPSQAKPHGTQKEHKVFLWIVPTNVAGTWRIEFNTSNKTIEPLDISFEQRFQRVTATVSRGSVQWAQLRGTELLVAWTHGNEKWLLRGNLATHRTGSKQWLGSGFEGHAADAHVKRGSF
ncbi:MAG: methyltransferase domain-containing protein, partial [Casimicrobium sp.]